MSPRKHPLTMLLLLCLLAAAAAATTTTTGQLLQPYDQMKAIKAHRGMHARPGNFLLSPRSRNDIGRLLEAMGFRTGVELGVKEGVFSNITLSGWPSCTRYYLVDIWKQQENYVDGSNVDNNAQDALMKAAQQRLARFGNTTVLIRNYTSDAVHIVPNHLDYVYVDARHDYCGAKEDIWSWWPKLRPGGIMAGHDYASAAESPPNHDWSLCADGQRNNGGVMGAVDEFAMHYGLSVSVTWGDTYRSWLLRKPVLRRRRQPVDMGTYYY